MATYEPTRPDETGTQAANYPSFDENPNLQLVREGVEEAGDETRQTLLEGIPPFDEVGDSTVDWQDLEDDNQEKTPEEEAVHVRGLPLDDLPSN